MLSYFISFGYIKTSFILKHCKNSSLVCVCGFFFFLLPISVYSQCVGSEVKPLTEDQGCDSVLLGQSNRTPHGAVIDEYGAMVE
jgi:hypothetical protein